MNLAMLFKVQEKLTQAKQYSEITLAAARKSNNPHAVIEAYFHNAETSVCSTIR
jgi:hypothetical protein